MNTELENDKYTPADTNNARSVTMTKYKNTILLI